MMIKKCLCSISPLLVESIFESHLPINREILLSKKVVGSITFGPRGRVPRAAKVHSKRTLAMSGGGKGCAWEQEMSEH